MIAIKESTGRCKCKTCDTKIPKGDPCWNQTVNSMAAFHMCSKCVMDWSQYMVKAGGNPSCNLCRSRIKQGTSCARIHINSAGFPYFCLSCLDSLKRVFSGQTSFHQYVVHTVCDVLVATKEGLNLQDPNTEVVEIGKKDLDRLTHVGRLQLTPGDVGGMMEIARKNLAAYRAIPLYRDIDCNLIFTAELANS